MRAYCVKCRAKKEMIPPSAITMRNGMPATQGKCPTCGTTIFRTGMAPRLHHSFTEDALSGIDGYTDEIADHVANHARAVDRLSPHGKESLHRVTKYQRVYEGFGGHSYGTPGAEECAEKHLGIARRYYGQPGNQEWQRQLGYAIHYIEDANWFPHVFPFKEGLGPHTWAELTTQFNYDARDWADAAKSAPAVSIQSSAQIKDLLVKAADDTFDNHKCNYLRQDGTKIMQFGDRSALPAWGWEMTEEDIRGTLRDTAGLVKGAAAWVTG